METPQGMTEGLSSFEKADNQQADTHYMSSFYIVIRAAEEKSISQRPGCSTKMQRDFQESGWAGDLLSMMGSQVNDTSKMGPSQLFKGWVPVGARSLFTDFMCVYGGGGGGRILDMRDVL